MINSGIAGDARKTIPYDDEFSAGDSFRSNIFAHNHEEDLHCHFGVLPRFVTATWKPLLLALCKQTISERVSGARSTEKRREKVRPRLRRRE